MGIYPNLISSFMLDDNNSDIHSQTLGVVADLIKEALSLWEKHRH